MQKRKWLILLTALALLLCAGCGGKRGVVAQADPDGTVETETGAEPDGAEEPDTLPAGDDGSTGDAALFGDDGAAEAVSPAARDLDAPDDTVDGLPPVPEDGYMEAAVNYVLDHYGDWFDGEVVLCSPLIYRVDRADPDEVKVWGYYWMTAYERSGGVMVTSGAGGPAGLLRMKPSDGGYEVFSFDMLSDGSDYETDVRRICGGDTELENRFLQTDQSALQEARLGALRTYARQNGLDITAVRESDGTEISIG